MKKKIIIIICLVLLLAAVIAAVRFAMIKYDKNSYPLKYSEFVDEQSEVYGVDRALIYAVIRTESSFNPEAVSAIGARGLMQITEPTFEWARSKMGSDFSDDVYDDLFDPETNIVYGTFLLSAFTEEFGSINNALCAYHAGWGNAKNWLENGEYAPDGKNITQIPFKDTRWYVNKINKVMEKYKSLYFSEKE